MDDPNKKVNQEETQTGKDEKIQVADDEAEKAAGGAKFESWEDKKPRRPR